MERDDSLMARRAFLGRVCAAGASAAVIGPAAAQAGETAAAPGLDLATVTVAAFRPHLGSRFRFQPEGGTASEVELIRARTLRRHRPHGRRVQHVPRRPAFALVFRGDAAAGLAQQTCAVVHDRLGRFPLFVVPLGPGRDGQMRYEAIFN